jgi:predicted flap endonuclease-1-like 5' DNA nuclease
MTGADAEAWERVVLKHIAVYVEGSKAPDDTFKDFANHVLHPRDGYWGGAPVKATEWYGDLVAALAKQDWQAVAYAAGVLSHYYTDPVMPFHTGQTEAENAIHRGCEWSINRSYNALRKDAEAVYADLEAPIPSGTNWLKACVCDGAEFSHRYYEKLIAHYDITRGAVSPEDGLDSVGRRIVSELLMYAAEGFGNLLDHAITEAGVAAPDVSLTVETVLATLRMPQKWLEKRLSNAEDRRIVQAMYDELKATGKVEASLPEDDRTIRDLYAAEVLAPKDTALAEARANRLGAAAPKPTAAAMQGDDALARAVAKSANGAPPTQLPPVLPAAAPTVSRTEPVASNVPVVPMAPVTSAPLVSAPAGPPKPVVAAPVAAPVAAVKPATPAAQSVPAIPPPTPPRAPDSVAEPVQAPLPKTPPSEPVKPAAAAHAPPAPASAAPPAPVVATPPLAASVPSAPVAKPSPPAATAPPTAPVHDIAPSTRTRLDPEPRKSYLSKSDDLEAAPSIGPKMAERFADLGIKSVGDFLGQDPHDMAEILDDSRIDAEMLTDWQDQAQLVIDVPGMRGTHAQLLVGAGYRTAEAIADADPVDLSADVLTFAASSDGKRILRDGNAPDLEKIKSWVDAAREALAA